MADDIKINDWFTDNKNILKDLSKADVNRYLLFEGVDLDNKENVDLINQFYDAKDTLFPADPKKEEKDLFENDERVWRKRTSNRV